MTPYDGAIQRAAKAHGLDPALVAAVVEQESGGRFYAYRYESAFFVRYLAQNPKYNTRPAQEVAASFGLMQVMFPTAVEHGFTGEPWDLFNPAKNLDIGCIILATLLKWARGQYQGLAGDEGSWVRRRALAAYNGGKGHAADAGPQDYAKQVIVRWVRLRADEEHA